MNEERKKQDYFGFLPWKWALEFEGGKILPHPKFEETAAWVDNYTHEDGFLYPPIEHRWVVDPFTMKPLRKIPKTEKPAHLYRIPPSHEICLSDLDIHEDIRKGPGSFLINLLAYLFGVRLQFHDWWLDGRLPIKERARTHSIRFTEKTAKEFLSHCYKTWKSWNEKEQRLITNLLFMHTRSPSYEWDWERFTIEYLVLDGCYKLATSLGIIKEKPSHADRVKALCRTFGIPTNDELVGKIVNFRNELFHETLWDGSQPCTAESGFAFILPFHLRRLNQRLIPALLGYKTQYIQTRWWVLGVFPFDPALEK